MRQIFKRMHATLILVAVLTFFLILIGGSAGLTAEMPETQVTFYVQ